jgi:LysM domain
MINTSNNALRRPITSLLTHPNLTATSICVLNAVFFCVMMAAGLCHAEDCVPKRNCDATRDCSVGQDTRDCAPHWNCPDCGLLDLPCHGRRIGCEADKVRYRKQCEIEKGTQNRIYEANKPVCEALKAGEKLDCERVKTQMRLGCELGIDGPFSCTPGEVMDQLRTSKQDGLTDFEMFSGAASTPFKKAGGQLSWRETDCQTSGATGKPYRNSQRSTDGFCTIDVQLTSFPIEDNRMPNGNHYIRIEALPGGKGANTCKDRTISTRDTIQFGGPIKIDKHFPGHKWLEVHVTDDFAFVVPAPPAAQPATSGAPAPSNVARPGSLYTIKKGDCLAKIAEQAYGSQAWPKIYRANRRLKWLTDPNLIYPDKIITVPPA